MERLLEYFLQIIIVLQLLIFNHLFIFALKILPIVPYFVRVAHLVEHFLLFALRIYHALKADLPLLSAFLLWLLHSLIVQLIKLAHETCEESLTFLLHFINY